MKKHLNSTLIILSSIFIGSCFFSNTNSENINSSSSKEVKDSLELFGNELIIKDKESKMESEDLEFGLNVNEIEVDKQGWVKLKFARDGHETIEFMDPKSIRYLTLDCRNSQNLPTEVLLFKSLSKLLIIGGNFADIGTELNQLNSLQNVAFASSNMKLFPISLLSSSSILNISILGNLYPINIPEDLCNVKKKMSMYFIGTQLIDENKCLQNNPNLKVVR